MVVAGHAFYAAAEIKSKFPEDIEIRMETSTTQADEFSPNEMKKYPLQKNSSH